MSQYVWGRGFAPDPRLVNRGKMTMAEYQKAHMDFYSKPLSEVRIPGPWMNWKGHPETRRGMGINYIQSALDSGLNLQDIRQKATENKWVIGADAWDKFYSDNEDTGGYEEDPDKGIWSQSPDHTQRFQDALSAYFTNAQETQVQAKSPEQPKATVAKKAGSSLKITGSKPKKNVSDSATFKNTMTL